MCCESGRATAVRVLGVQESKHVDDRARERRGTWNAPSRAGFASASHVPTRRLCRSAASRATWKPLSAPAPGQRAYNIKYLFNENKNSQY